MRQAQAELTSTKQLAVTMFKICDLLNLPRTLDIAEFLDQLYRNGYLSRQQLRQFLEVLGLTEADLWPERRLIN